jgi:NADH-quinone oxidoreductase subunit E
MHEETEVRSLPDHSIELPEPVAKFIEEWKDKPGNLIMVLHKVQEHYGYVPRDVAFEVAARLRVPLAKIYGVITFYHFFKLRKPGRHQIAVCMGTACYLKGGEDLIKELETILGIGLNQTTPDGEFSLEAVRCIGCCGLAPVLTVDGQVYGRLTKDQLADIVARHRGA